MRILGIFLSVGTLLGCSTVRDLTGQSDYVVTQASPSSITIEFAEGELSQTQGRAQSHCEKYQRTALMLTVSPANGGSVATFNCV